MSYELLIKPAYRTRIRTLPHRDAELVERKVDLLIENPHPDSKNKKRIVSYKEPVFRIRAGDYRVLYMFSDEDRWVSLLLVDDREDVYAHGELVDTARPAFDVARVPAAIEEPARLAAGGRTLPAEEPLDRPVTRALLERAGIDREWFDDLVGCRTIEALIAAHVPESIRAVVFDAVATPPLDAVIAQPSFVVRDVDDLIRYQRGELIEFLLKLDAEQERHVTRAINAGGPVLVKGGPGTGKSTIAIYRTLEVYRSLQAGGVAHPRILFTTYTNALINSTRQLIQQLFGREEIDVTVHTADKIATDLVTRHAGFPQIVDSGTLRAHLMAAFNDVQWTHQPALAERLAALRGRLSLDYFIDEIETVIVARELDQEAYGQVQRTGRKVRLTAPDREVFWRLHRFITLRLHAKRQTTWARMRLQAAHLVESGAAAERYDAVFIDEAQDLQPTTLRMLVGLCRSPDRLMLTADANQSIYGSGFSWTEVHGDLRFRGRTGLLRKNYRSTREVGIAAASYLQEAGLEPERTTIEHVTSGPVPAVRFVTPAEECPLLAAYFRQATRDLRLGFGSCAVLVPREEAGHAVERQLRAAGIGADFMPGKALDLRTQGVKIITHRSAKGLEFPIVALAGFSAARLLGNETDEEREERAALERRALYVAMTRAMRTLLVLAPITEQTLLFTGFTEPLWNLGGA